MLRKLLLASLGLLALGQANAQVQTYAKPVVRDAWADEAASGDIADPGNTFVAAGWLSSSTPPARQFFNFALNYPSEGIRYFSQRGIVDWDTLETYAIGAVVQSGGVIYRSVVNSNTGHTPATSPSQWGGLFFGGNSTFSGTVTSNVSSGNASAFSAAGPANSQINGLTITQAGQSPIFLFNPAGSSNFDINIGSTNIAQFLSGGGMTLSGVTVATTTFATAAANNAESAAISTAESFANTVANNAQSAAISTSEAFTNSAIAPLAPLASPAFTGVPSAPTAAPGSNNDILANTAFVQAAVNPNSRLTGTGFQEFGNGLVIEWGTQACASTGTSIALPLTLVTTFGIHLTALGEAATTFVESIGSGGGTFVCVNGQNAATFWTAIGVL
jgi:hypothetical protein